MPPPRLLAAFTMPPCAMLGAVAEAPPACVTVNVWPAIGDGAGARDGRGIRIGRVAHRSIPRAGSGRPQMEPRGCTRTYGCGPRAGAARRHRDVTLLEPPWACMVLLVGADRVAARHRRRPASR